MQKNVIIQHKAAGLPVPISHLPVQYGMNIEEIAYKFHGSCDGIQAFVRSSDRVMWEQIPREQWKYIRPIADDAVMFVHRINGGDDNQIFAVIAMIAITAIAGPLAGALFPGLAAGSFALNLATAAITVGGSLLINKLFPPDTPSLAGFDPGADDSEVFSDVSSDSNVLGKQAFLPIVINRRVSPPDVVQPRTYLTDGIQTIDRLLALEGHHSLTDIQVDGTPISDFNSITSEIIDGQESSGQSTIITNISVPVQISETLSTFTLDGTALTDQNTTTNSEPRWAQFATPYHEKLEELNIRLRIDGAYKTSSTTQEIRIPLRVQFREKGGTSADWVSLPEIHAVGRTQTTKIVELRIRWDDEFGNFSTGGEFSFEFWQRVPEVTSHDLSDGSNVGSPSGDQWQADSWFVNGSGLQETKKITDRRHDIRVQLDPTLHPKGELEWRIIRGYIVDSTSLTSSYTYGGNVVSMFLGRDVSNVWRIPLDQGVYTATINAVQATAIADERPIQWPRTASIGLRSIGQTFRKVTVHANRYILDWNGSAWATSTSSSKNPASHARHFLFEFLKHFGFSTSLINNDQFVAWRQECIDRGYECSGVFAGESEIEVLNALATAGFARMRISDGFGVDYFKDRSADIPVQMFSPRNTSEITFSLSSPERPSGYRASFVNEDDDYRNDEIEVVLDNAADVPSYEPVTYKAISKPSLVRRRAYFDLLQVNERRREWYVSTSLEGVVCEIGDLVSIVTDLFNDKSHGVRIREIIDTTHIRIDQTIPAEDVPNDFSESPEPSVSDLFNVGESSTIFVTTPTGVTQGTIIGAENDIIRLDTPLTTTNMAGVHANIVNTLNASHRCFVVGIDRKGEEEATLTLVDESPQIYEKMNEKFG